MCKNGTPGRGFEPSTSKKEPYARARRIATRPFGLLDAKPYFAYRNKQNGSTFRSNKDSHTHGTQIKSLINFIFKKLTLLNNKRVFF